MAWFVKTETFTTEMACLSVERRRLLLKAHHQWVQEQKDEGRLIYSGYLVDKKKNPGGGGLMIFKADNYEEAWQWVQNDPLISEGTVFWNLQEWIVDKGLLFE